MSESQNLADHIMTERTATVIGYEEHPHPGTALPPMRPRKRDSPLQRLNVEKLHESSERTTVSSPVLSPLDQREN